MQQKYSLSSYYLQPFAERFFTNYLLTDIRAWVVDYKDNTYQISSKCSAKEVFEELFMDQIDPESINYIEDSVV